MVVELHEVGGGRMSGIGGVEVPGNVVGIAPYNDVADGVSVDDGHERVRPPVVGLDALETRLGECRQLVVLGCKIADHGEVGVEVFGIGGTGCGVGIGCVAIGVKTEDVDDVIAGVAFHIFLWVALAFCSRRIGIEGVDHSLLFESVNGELPEGFVLLGGAELLPPPEPRPRMLMPRSEDDWHMNAVGCLERVEEVGNDVEPREEFVVLLTTFEHRCNGVEMLFACRVVDPRCAAREWVVEMPREGDDSPALEMAHNLVVHALEGHAVEVDRVAQLKMSEVEGEQGGIVTTNTFDIASGGVAHPSDSVHHIVLMTKHPTTCGRLLLEVGKQVLGALGATCVGQRVMGFVGNAA